VPDDDASTVATASLMQEDTKTLKYLQTATKSTKTANMSNIFELHSLLHQIISRTKLNCLLMTTKIT